MEKYNYRFYIKTRVALGISATSICQELETAYGDQAPCYSTVQRWAKLFKDGREVVEDDPRCGRPITSLTPINIELVRQAVEENPHITYIEIEAETSLSRGTIERILQDSLKLRKVTSRWIPHFLSDENRAERVAACRENLAMFSEGKWRLYDIITGDESWIYWRQIGRKSANASWIGEGETPRTVVRRSQFEPKTMISVFFRTTGLVHLSALNRGETINATSYVVNCLKPIINAKNGKRQFFIFE